MGWIIVVFPDSRHAQEWFVLETVGLDKIRHGVRLDEIRWGPGQTPQHARSNGLLQPMGAHRAIAVRLLNERLIWAYPIVGIPSAETLNDVATKAKKAERGEVPVLVYDYIGIRDSWMAHLAWLDAQIKAVKTIRVSEAGWALAGMDE
ncbi:hypothetical protein QO004_006289 [Rhizobium mesoamericanum]|nr:hypothetical protein [Rhizobium mesoamericanum]